MPIKPANTRPCSTCSFGLSACFASASSSSQRAATPSVRSASPASSSLVRRISSRRTPVRERRPSPTSSNAQRVSRTSGAPLVNTIPACSSSVSRWIVLINLRSDENGTSPTRGSRLSRSASLRPHFRAATISAPSVGSPWTVQRPSRSSTAALLARSATASARSISSLSGPSIDPPPSLWTDPSGA